jgi:signal transduction histidine kinase
MNSGTMLDLLFHAIDAPVVVFDDRGTIRCMNLRAGSFLGDRTAVPWDPAGIDATTTEGSDLVEWTFHRAGDAVVATGRIVTTEARLREGIAVLERSEEQERAVADFGFSALTEHDLGAVMREACHLVRRALGCDATVILGHDAKSAVFRGAAAAGTDVEPDQIVVDDDPRTPTRHAFDTDQAVLVNDIESDPHFHSQRMSSLGYRAILCVAVTGPYARYGTLSALSRTPSAFTERDAVFIRSIANLVAAAMARRAAEDESSRARRDYHQLRVHAERTQLEREARLQMILGNLPVIIWTTDRELNITSLGGAGMQMSSDVATTLPELMGNRDFSADLTRPLGGRAVAFETRMLGREVRARVEPFRDAEGVIIGTVGVAYDVTEQVAAERAREDLLQAVARSASEWRATFDSIGSAVLLLDGEHRIARVNAAALTLTGHAQFRDVVGLPVQAVSALPLWSEILSAAMTSRRRQAPVTLRARAAERRWDVVVASGPAHTTVVVSDVTAIARMEESLQRSERMSSMGALVAGVAHEVRNPLFGISATLDAFEARFGDEQFRRYTSALREQLQRMNELMYDLLELGRPASSLLAPGPLTPVITTAVSSVRMLAQHANVTVETKLASDLPSLPMDRTRLLQVVENLLSNAIQHSPAGGVVEVSAEFEEETASVLVCIEDRGAGFREEDLPRLFEPFFTRRRGGTGLGLSLVQRIVDDHHGHIEVRNREGGGASVRVSLPTGTSEA